MTDEVTTAMKDPSDGRESRRSALKKLAVGAGAVWVAPVVLSQAAGAQNGSGIPVIPGTPPRAPEALAFKCGTTNGTSVTETLDVNPPKVQFPTNTVAGDFIFVIVAVGSTGNSVTSLATLGGESLLPAIGTSSLSGFGNGQTGQSPLQTFVFAKKLTSDPLGGISVTISNTSSIDKYSIAVLRVTATNGVNTTAGFSGSASSPAGTAQTSSSVPGISVAAQSLAVNIVVTNDEATFVTDPNNWTDLGNASETGAGSGCGANRPDVLFQAKGYSAAATADDATSSFFSANNTPAPHIWAAWTYNLLPD